MPRTEILYAAMRCRVLRYCTMLCDAAYCDRVTRNAGRGGGGGRGQWVGEEEEGGEGGGKECCSALQRRVEALEHE
eukprot:1108658-Rhodomonas_salina.1